MIHRFLHHQSSSVASAALLLSGASVAGVLLGFFRNTLLAARFGAGDELDIYFAAFRIPDFFFNVLFLGALSAGFIPVFLSLWDERDPDAAWKLTDTLITVILIVFSIASILGILFAPYLMKYVAPGFSGEKLHTTVTLTRIMLLQPILLAISSVFSGILQSLQRFFIYALTPVVYTGGIIVGIVFFTPFLGVMGLGFGVILGALFHALIQIPAIERVGFRYRPVVDLTMPEFRKVLMLMAPRSLCLIIVHVNLLVITIVASLLGRGALAIFNFAFDLQSLPVRLIAASFAVAAFPTLAREASPTPLFRSVLVKTIRDVAFFLIPATGLFFILRAQIVRVTLGYGAFAQGWGNTSLTAAVLGALTLGILAQGLYLLLIRAFFALHNSRVPLIVGIASAFANTGFSIWFAHLWGVPGLAYAFILAQGIQVLLLFAMLLGIVPELSTRELWGGIAQFLFAGLIATINTYAALYILAGAIETNTVLGIFSQGLFAGLIGIGTYLLILRLLGAPETSELLSVLRRGVRKIPFPINGAEDGPHVS